MDISYLGLALSLLLFAVPCALLWRIGGGLLRTLAVSVVRMAVQLLFVAFYMKWLFAANSVALDLLWVLAFTAVATVSVAVRSSLRLRHLFLPIGAGLLVPSLLVGLYLLVGVVRPASVVDAHCLVPVVGLLLSGIQGVCVAAFGAYYSSLRSGSQLYHYLLGNGATHREAVAPFLKAAVGKALAPMVANLSSVGLVSMPGMMMGAMLGGVAPGVAVVWQMGVFGGVLASSVLAVLLALHLADSRVFDQCGRLRHILRDDKLASAAR